MLNHSPVLRVIVILLAVIGAFTVVAFSGMAMMGGSMMSMMGGDGMVSMCQNMMGWRP